VVELVKIDVVLRTKGAIQTLTAFGAGFDKVGTKAAAAVTKTETAFTRLKKTIVSTRSLFAAFFAIQIFRGIVNTIREFEAAMLNVRAIIKGVTDEDFERLNKKARELGGTTPFTARQVAEGMRFLAQAGQNVGDIMDSIEPSLRLAQVGMLDLGTSADIVTNIMAGFGLEASRTAEIADVLAVVATSSNTNIRQLGEAMKFVAPAAATTGRGVREVAAAIGILGNAGLQASIAGTGLRQALLKLSRASNPAKKALHDMGLELKDLDPTTKTIVQIISLLAEKNLTIAQSSAIFEARAGTAILALVKQKDALLKLTEATDAIEDTNGALETMVNIISVSLDQAIRNLQSAIESLILSAGDKGLTLVLKVLVDLFTNVIRAMAGTLDPATQGALVFQVLAFAIEALGFVLIASGIAKFWKLFLSLAGRLIGPLGALASSFRALGGALGILRVAAPAGAALGIGGALVGLLGPVGAVIAVITLLGLAISAANRATEEGIDPVKRQIELLKEVAPLVEEAKKADEARTRAIKAQIFEKVEDEQVELRRARAIVATQAAELAKKLGPFASPFDEFGPPQDRRRLPPSMVPLIKELEKANKDVRRFDELLKENEDFRREIFRQIREPLKEEEKGEPSPIDDTRQKKIQGVMDKLREEIRLLSVVGELERKVQTALGRVGLAGDQASPEAATIRALVVEKNRLEQANKRAAAAEAELKKVRDSAQDKIGKFTMDQRLLNVELAEYKKALDEGVISQGVANQLSEQATEKLRMQNPLYAEAQKLIKDTKTNQELLNEGTERLNLLQAEGFLTVEEYTKALDRLKNKFGEVDERAKALGAGLAGAFTDAFKAAIFDGEKLSDVFKNLEKAIFDMLTQILVLEPLEKSLRTFFTGAATTTGGSASSGGGFDFLGFVTDAASSFFGGVGGFGGGRPVATGLQHGGSFLVQGGGGPDSELVQFRASPGERVTVTPKGESRSGSRMVVQNNFTVQGSFNTQSQSRIALAVGNSVRRTMTRDG